MSSSEQNPQEGIAHAVSDLGEQTAMLVRREVEAVKDEMAGRVKQLLPAAGLAAVSAAGAFFACASVYRLVARIPEKLFGPVLGPMLAAGGFGAAAFLAGQKAMQVAREAPAPVPSETARTTRQAVERTVEEYRP